MRSSIVAAALALCACADAKPRPPITVFAAASLARPLKALTDSFQRVSRVPALVEVGGSLEHARKLTDLGRVPDVIILADDDVMASLAPAHLAWYVRFATNQLGVAYGTRSVHRDSITSENWWRILAKRGVRVGRADPTTAPVGTHALNLIRRVDGYYNRSGAGDSIMARALQQYVRPNATELAALLETGEVDYIIEYESVARQYGFEFVALPPDLSPAILYGIGVPRLATNTEAGIEFTAYMLSYVGKRMLRDARIRVLETPVAVGTDVPSALSPLVRTSAAPR
jgi:molybdate/tungstate transport system substrate-binding protein